MKKRLAIILVPFTGGGLAVGLALEDPDLAKQLFAAVVVLGFGFFVFVGHRLLAEKLVDWYDSKFGKESNDHL